MSDQESSTTAPQFGTAEYKSSPSGDICRVCGQALPGVYYRANRAMVCAGCVERVRVSVPKDSHAAFVRALIFGFGGFLAGLILYAGFTIITGIQIGFMSLGVGWLVGKAMLLGSGGIGGRRYQIAAVLVTYAAVSMAFVPIAIYYVKTKPAPKPLPHFVAPTPEAAPPPGSAHSSPAFDTPSPEPPAAAAQPTPAATPTPRMSFGRALGMAILLGLASPFLELQDGYSGVIGLIILFVGMRFAWKMTAGTPRIVIEGPFDNSKSLR